ncbi:MAG: hypothetical protein ACI30I_01435 [Parabacteroides sp.]
MYTSRRYTITTPLTCFYLLVGCLVCWIKGYVDSVGYPVYGEVMAPPLWNDICRVLPGKFYTYLLGILLMSGGAFLLHRANYTLMLIREKTFLPFLLYILFISSNPDFMPLKSTSVGVFCLVLSIYQLFLSYHDDEAVDHIYNASLILGVGSLLWTPLLLFVPLYWWGMYNFRSMSPRTFMASLLGAGTVYWFLIGWCIWKGDFSAFLAPFSSLVKIHMLSNNDSDPMQNIGAIYLFVITLMAAANIMRHEYEDNLRTRQFLYFLILLTIWTFALYGFYHDPFSEELLELACMPVSILLSHFFTVCKGKAILYLFHFTILFYLLLSFVRLWNF